MELESTTTIREKISWIEDQPIAWDKNLAWMRIERGSEKTEPGRKIGYYAAAAVVVLGIVTIVAGDYRSDVVSVGVGISEAIGAMESAKEISNIEYPLPAGRQGISNVEVMCGPKRADPPLGARGVRPDGVLLSSVELETEPLILLPEPIEGERIAIVDNPKSVVAPVERVRAIFGVEEQPTVAMIRQGKKLRIYFLQHEVSQSQSPVVNIDEPSALEARLNKK